MPGRHKKGSKGECGGYGGYKRRYRWPQRHGQMETAAERELRAQAIAEFIKRGGRIKRYPLAIAPGAMPIRPGADAAWAVAELQADVMAELQA